MSEIKYTCAKCGWASNTLTQLQKDADKLERLNRRLIRMNEAMREYMESRAWNPRAMLGVSHWDNFIDLNPEYKVSVFEDD